MYHRRVRQHTLASVSPAAIAVENSFSQWGKLVGGQSRGGVGSRRRRYGAGYTTSSFDIHGVRNLSMRGQRANHLSCKTLFIKP